MVDGVNAAQEVRDEVAVAGVALVEVDLGTQVRGPPIPVYRRGQRVEHDDVVPEREEPVAGVRSDEPRTAGDEDLHFRRRRRRSATSRYTSRVDAAVAAHVNWPARRSPSSRRRSLPGPTASTMARAMDAGSLGSDRTAAPPAVSGMALVSEVTTGQPQAMASRIGKPEGLVERRIDEDVGRLVEADGLLERNSTDEDHIARDAELGGERVQLGDVLLVAAGTDDRQLAIRRAHGEPAPMPAAIRRSSCTATATTRTARTAS